MSVKNRCERTAKRGWIPLVFGLLATSSVVAAPPAAGPMPGSTSAARGGETLRIDGVWDEMMRWLLQRLVEKMNCGSPSIPDDVPVAMLMMVDCYITGGLADMTPEETVEFLITIDEAMQGANAAPASIPVQTLEKFQVTLKAMRAEAVTKQ